MTATHFRSEELLLQTAVHTRGQSLSGLEPVDYFIMPEKAPTYGRAVIGLVTLDRRGYPQADVPRIYAVGAKLIGEEADIFDNPHAVAQAREYHVVAEDLAMQRGILTASARPSAEIYVADRLPYSHREQYLKSRIPHLDATRRVVLEANEPAAPKRTVVTELSVAIEALKDRLEQLKD